MAVLGETGSSLCWSTRERWRLVGFLRTQGMGYGCRRAREAEIRTRCEGAELSSPPRPACLVGHTSEGDEVPKPRGGDECGAHSGVAGLHPRRVSGRTHGCLPRAGSNGNTLGDIRMVPCRDRAVGGPFLFETTGTASRLLSGGCVQCIGDGSRGVMNVRARERWMEAMM